MFTWRRRQVCEKAARRRRSCHRERRRCCLRCEELEPRVVFSAANAPAAPLADQALTTDPGVQQMPSVAVDPHDANHLVVAYMDYSLLTTGYAGIGVKISADGGATWTKQTAIPLPADFDQGAANPVAHFDDQGHVFVSFMAATFLGPEAPLTNANFQDRGLPGVQSNNGIFVARSDNGGLSWQPPVAVVSHLYDGRHQVFFEVIPDLAIDTFRTLPNGRPNPNYGNEYVVWTRIYPAGQFPGQPDPNGGTGTDIMIAVSKDRGQSWTTEVQDPSGLAARGESTLEAAATGPVTVLQDTANDAVNPVGVGPMDQAHVAIGPEGDIYVSSFSGGDFGVLHSTDGGASFLPPDHQTGRGIAFGIGDTAFMAGLANNQFRTNAVRAIVTDPTRPGYLYAAEPVGIVDATGNTIDSADVFFARSTDYGQHWTTTFQVGPNPAAGVLNDDNGGNKAANLPDDVVSGQAMARLAVNAQGDIAVIWYDTRHDPQNHLLDVFGTVSSDGGQTFSANFRLTDTSFDANQGAFTDATGNTDSYLGDFLGLSLSNDAGYAAWADTRNENQDVYFTSFPLSPAPAPPNDRFEPNDTPQRATDLGAAPVVKEFLPKLALPAGDQDWFRLKAAATGDLTVTAMQAGPGNNLQLQLWDETGTTLLAGGTELDSDGSAVGQQITFPGSSGKTYLVRVVSLITDGSESNGYSLRMQSLTADLGTAVHGSADGALGPGDQAYYLLKAPATGSLEVNLTPGADVQGSLNLEVVDPNTLTVLASGSPAPAGDEVASLPVVEGQAVLLHVSGAAADAQGSFSLEFTNLDQFTTAQNASLLVPAGAGPSQVALGDLNGDGKLDMVVSNTGTNTVSVFVGNGDGTFQAPRQFAVGAFKTPNPATNGRFPTFRRDVAIADLNGDRIPDIVVTNYDSGDVSVLLGRGDGTFEPQRRYDATAGPFALAVGDVNGDGIPDLTVVDAVSPFTVTVAVLQGRGDGTFLPERTFQTPFASSDNFPYSSIHIADLNGDGKGDLIVSGLKTPRALIYLSNGDGTFQPVTDPQDGQLGFPAGGLAAGLAVGDINGDGKLDIVTTSLEVGAVDVLLGNGDGTFQALENFNYFPVPHQDFTAGQTPLAVTLADVATSGFNADGSIASTVGKPDGHPDLIVAASGVVLTLKSVGPPGVFVLPAIWSGSTFIGFDAPHLLAAGEGPQDVKEGDFNGDGVPDFAAVDRNGVRVIFGKPPTIPANDTLQTARNLGTVVHLVEPTLTLVPGHMDAYYKLTVPTEAVAGAGDEVLDFSGLFQYAAGAGLGMEVRDAQGNLLGSGERFRVRAPEGAVLALHVFGQTAADGSRGAGAYTLEIDVLPQIVSVQAQSLLPGQGAAPGGPTASLVVTFQGDRLDPATAENPANYTVIFRGIAAGTAGPADSQLIPVAAGLAGAMPAVYDPGSNVDVATGNQYPVAVRQTVTLLFADPLRAGSYVVQLSPNIQAAPFSQDEAGMLAPTDGFTGHPVVSADGGRVVEGGPAAAQVVEAGPLGDFATFQAGTPFLTQLHDDLGAVLDAGLTQLSDDPAIPVAVDRQIQDRFVPALGPADQRPTAVLVLWLDPVSFAVKDATGHRDAYDLTNNAFANTIPNTSVIVTGNIEVAVLPINPVLGAQLVLDVSQVPAHARGGAIFLGRDATQVQQFTADLRQGVRSFALSFNPSTPPPDSYPGNAVTVAPPSTGGAVPNLPSGPARAAAAGMAALTVVRIPFVPTLPADAPSPGSASSNQGSPGAVQPASAQPDGSGVSANGGSASAEGSGPGPNQRLPDPGGSAGPRTAEQMLADLGAALRKAVMTILRFLRGLRSQAPAGTIAPPRAELNPLRIPAVLRVETVAGRLPSGWTVPGVAAPELPPREGNASWAVAAFLCGAVRAVWRAPHSSRKASRRVALGPRAAFPPGAKGLGGAA